MAKFEVLIITTTGEQMGASTVRTTKKAAQNWFDFLVETCAYDAWKFGEMVGIGLYQSGKGTPLAFHTFDNAAMAARMVVDWDRVAR